MTAPVKPGFYWFRRRLRLRLCCSPAQPTHRMPCTGSYDPAGFQPTLHNWQNMFRCSSSQNPRKRRLGDRSRSPPGSCDKDTGSTLCIEEAAAELERDEEIFLKLKKVFPTVSVSLQNKEITFFGDTRTKADSMMFLFRYLSNQKNINCSR